MTEQFVRGHSLFVRRYFTEREYFANLAKKQTPRALYIGCSDSRVVPELLTNSGPRPCARGSTTARCACTAGSTTWARSR